MWKQYFDLVISNLKQYEHLKSNAYYLKIQNQIQIIKVPYAASIIVPCKGTKYKLNDLYLYQSSSLMFIYKFLKKQCNYKLHPNIVIYDYLCFYYDMLESIRDKYESYNYYVEILIFDKLKKWLDVNDSILIAMIETYKRICKSVDDQYISILKSEYNSNILECYKLIKHKLPLYNPVLSYLLK